MSKILEVVQAPINKNIPEIIPGDTVSVSVKIKEGDRERIQEFKGVIIAIRKKGLHETFTVRRIASNGIGVERTFLMRSPRIDKVVVDRHGKVRRAKLFYLRERTGKKARLAEKFS
ncbi:MAG: 50S ribosomal protein L19 [Anaerolineaceae bacterium]|nr:50S ribosomal protein L19 [Anaerolineaceae bacterium]